MARRALSEQDAIAERARFDLQGRLQRSYVRAINDIERKLKAHLERYEAAEKRWRDRIAKGEATEEDFRVWRMGQEFTGKRWRDMRDQIVADLYRVNQQSVNAVNKERTNVFADNANYEMYELDQHGRMGMGWTVYNRQSVERLLRDDPELLPAKEISKMKDGVWNRKKVNGAVAQGIIQGESIPQIAKRIAQVTGSQNLQQMVSFARTAMTGAQNAGRIEAMHQAQSLGIKLKKRWMATLDHRTRDAHQELDMQTVDVDEPFEVFGQEIMFPGDPNAAPELVMNCRCTLVQFHPEYPPQAMKRRDNETKEVIDAVSYKEWLADQKQPAKPTAKQTGTEQRKPEKPTEKRPDNEQPILAQFKRYDTATRTDAEKLAQANPHYNESPAYRVNCQRTVVAEELIYRGYDVIAKPRDMKDPIKDNGIVCWDIDIKNWKNDKGFRIVAARSEFKPTVEEAFREWGEGARAIVRVQWQKQYGGNGHFFTAMLQNGKIRYVDPQSGKVRDIDETLSNCTTSANRMWLMRVDNRNLTDLVTYAVQNRED